MLFLSGLHIRIPQGSQDISPRHAAWRFISTRQAQGIMRIADKVCMRQAAFIRLNPDLQSSLRNLLHTFGIGRNFRLLGDIKYGKYIGDR
jgi:hypothetical protein